MGIFIPPGVLQLQFYFNSMTVILRHMKSGLQLEVPEDLLIPLVNGLCRSETEAQQKDAEELIKQLAPGYDFGPQVKVNP